MKKLEDNWLHSDVADNMFNDKWLRNATDDEWEEVGMLLSFLEVDT